MDARMKKFPLKLPADWAAAAPGLGVGRGPVPTRSRPALSPGAGVK